MLVAFSLREELLSFVILDIRLLEWVVTTLSISPYC